MSGKRGPRSSSDRVRGLLAMLPWLMQRKHVSIADMAKQFNISEEDLVADLEMAAMCGVPPYTPLELTELFIDEGFIEVGVNKYFEQRLELTSAEAFGLSLLAQAASEIPEFKSSKHLKNAVQKLRKILGSEIVDVDVEAPVFLQDVIDASVSGERLQITYWTPAKNMESERTIVVRSVFTDRGRWYITADDDASGDTRHFRVDRVRAVTGTRQFVPVRSSSPDIPTWFSDSSHAVTVTADVASEASWVVETYPCTVLEERADGSLRINIVVSSEHWLSRLMLRAEGGVTIVSPSHLVDVGQRAARSVLERYVVSKSGY